MKKFIIAAIAASLVSTPVLAAPNARGSDNQNRAEQNERRPAAHGAQKHASQARTPQRPVSKQTVQKAKWQRGDRFDSRNAVNYRVIDNPRAYRLDTAPRGYRWVQSGNDAILVGIASGIIASIISNSIR